MTNEPVVMQSKKLHLLGLGVRTNNAAESNPETGKIGPLWGKFHMEGLADKIPGQTNQGVIFAVYSNYESDQNGEYDLTIAVETAEDTPAEGDFTTLKIPAGSYLVFSAEGPVPQATVTLWQKIWKYFEDNSAEQRAFTYDYELYSADDPFKVDIYIAIKE